MRKGTLAALFVFIMFNGFGQTLTFDNLRHLLTEKNEDKYLRSKGFSALSSQITLGHTITYYVIHNQSPQVEQVITGLGVTKKDGLFLQEVGYTEKDARYIYLLMKQIKAEGFKLVKQTQRKLNDEYRFEKDNLLVLVTVQNQPDLPNQVNIRYKSY
jgi:hypothetical protein